MPIPKIIHQTWKDFGSIPPVFEEYHKTWTDLHPDWDYRFWSDTDLDHFVHDYYNQYYGLYRRYPWAIQRVDVARYLILEHFGGVYVDMDFECIRPFDTLVEQYDAFLGQEPTVQARKVYKRPEVIANALIGSCPGHPMWEEVRNSLRDYCEEPILHSTGPGFLDTVLRPFTEDVQYNIYLAVPDMFYPEVARGFPQHPVRAENVWAIHHWANTWV